MASVSVREVHKSFDDTAVIHGVSIDIEDGEFLVLVGPSGCGKSTLLRMIAGLEDVNDGEIAIGDKVVNHMAPKTRDVAMVFQNYALYPHMTVRQNMGFSLRLRKADKKLIRERVDSAAQILGLTDLLNRLPRQLSGGERQRVAMGRAIVRDPQVFLFDEPLSNLGRQASGADADRDQGAAPAAQDHLDLRHPRSGRSHDHGRAHRGDEPGPGRTGRPPARSLRPASEPLRRGFHRLAGNEPHRGFGHYRKRHAGRRRGRRHGPAAASRRSRGRGAAAVYGVRPEDLALATNGAGVEVTVSVVEPTGSSTLVFCQMAGQEICAEFQERHDFDPGETIRLMPRLETLHLFDRESGQRLNV